MSIRNHLVNQLGFTHLFMLEDASRLGPGITTAFNAGGGNFNDDSLCEGASKSYRSNSNTSEHGTIANTSDINSGSDLYRKRTTVMWFKSNTFNSPTCIYEQGGDTNNFAFILGLGKAITYQAADAGQPFLIAQSNFIAIANRAYFVAGIWEHHSEHSGNGNRVQLYINGINQEIVELNGTDVFPSHIGDIAIGNTNESLKSYNESTMAFSGVEKNINMLGFANDKSLTSVEIRDLFERTVKPEIVIVADTVANQQTALDAYSGFDFSSVNCAIRIVQATDATDYRLFMDNITFEQDSNLGDIAIQFVGAGNLTIENCNGSNAEIVCSPVEVDVDGTTIISGGGSVSIINGSTRLTEIINLNDQTIDKLVLSLAGTYTFTSSRIVTVENASDGEIIINAIGTIIVNTIGNIVINQKVIFTGLPETGVVGAWLASQGDSNRLGMVTVEATDGIAELTLERNTQYLIASDAIAFIRGGSFIFDTATQSTTPITLQRLVDSTGNDLITPVEQLSTGAMMVFNAVNYSFFTGNIELTWPQQLIDSGVTNWKPNAEDLFAGLACKAEIIQSSTIGLALLTTIAIRNALLERAATGTVKFSQDIDNPDGVIFEWTAITIRVAGTTSLDDLIDQTNGVILFNSGDPIVPNINVAISTADVPRDPALVKLEQMLEPTADGEDIQFDDNAIQFNPSNYVQTFTDGVNS